MCLLTHARRNIDAQHAVLRSLYAGAADPSVWVEVNYKSRTSELQLSSSPLITFDELIFRQCSS